jgi:hypothetical protein
MYITCITWLLMDKDNGTPMTDSIAHLHVYTNDSVYGNLKIMFTL